GNFMYGNASLSYYDKTNKTIENQVFYRANGLPVGDVLQSVALRDSLAYLVVNNSGKIYVINKDNFKYSAKITDFVSPRYICFAASKAYVTDMYSRAIYVVNPRTNSIEKSISVDDGSGEYYRNSTEQMLVIDSLLFVNCWSYDDKVLVVNTKTDEILARIETLKQPRRMVVDKNKKIWVLCDGGVENSAYFGESGLVKIDATTQSVEDIYELPQTDAPTSISINKTGDTVYFVNNHVYRFSVEGANPSYELFYENTGGRCYYGLGVDPYNSEVYVADAVDYMQSGVVYRLRPDAKLVDEFRVGIIPNGFCFK
ncbi:MAG: YncE family protein, partial [Bacteroidales bacterium]|nr:YncE family protein [Bacteroidales bacterium]